MTRIIVYSFCFLLLSNCGFSVLKRPPINFEIVNIDTVGDKKFFKLRNDFYFKRKQSRKLVKSNRDNKNKN